MIVHWKPHIGAALVIVDNKGGDVVDSVVARTVLLGKHTADNSDGVANLATHVESKNDGNTRLNVWEDVTGDIWAGEIRGVDSRPLL